jgi:hypothetical protein
MLFRLPNLGLAPLASPMAPPFSPPWQTNTKKDIIDLITDFIFVV